MPKKNADISAEIKELVPANQPQNIYLELVKKQIMGVDNQGNPRKNKDLLLFLYTCKRTGLDPLTNQIYAVFRWDSRLGEDRMSIQVGIDGLRSIAERTGKYVGQDPIKYDSEDSEYPKWAEITVYKNMGGKRVPFTAKARWSEYAVKYKDKLSGMWKKMPYLMLGKCAEALALRKAFPMEMSGLYSPEEMGKEDPLADLPSPKKRKEKPTKRRKTAAKSKKGVDITKKRKALKKEAK